MLVVWLQNRVAVAGLDSGEGELRMIQCGILGGLTRPMSQNTWCLRLTVNWFTVNQFRIVLDFSGMLLNHSTHL